MRCRKKQMARKPTCHTTKGPVVCSRLVALACAEPYLRVEVGAKSNDSQLLVALVEILGYANARRRV
jgi:hypothetical protein